MPATEIKSLIHPATLAGAANGSADDGTDPESEEYGQTAKADVHACNVVGRHGPGESREKSFPRSALCEQNSPDHLAIPIGHELASEPISSWAASAISPSS